MKKFIRNLEISKCLEWLRVFLDKEEASVGHFQCLASFQRRVAAIYYGKLLEVPKEIVNNKGASVPFEVDLALNVSKCRYKYIKTKRFLKVAVVCCVVLLLTLGMVLLRVGS